MLNIALSIMRDFDMTGASFSNLDDISGVVVIDEVDLHLHADLQCNILPAVLKMFPKVQFILTTHSPLFMLGMKTEFGEEGCDVLSLPTGNNIAIEEFAEFRAAFRYWQRSDICVRKIEEEVHRSHKSVVFFEGDYDLKYVAKAASLFDKEHVLEQLVLCNGEGFGNLDKIWKICDNRLAMVLPKTIARIYDCDTEKGNKDRHMARKRVIPSQVENPIRKGIENLFPSETIQALRQSMPLFFDITPEITRIVRGRTEKQPEVCEINKSEKRNMCDWLCEHGTADDFKHFQSLFAILEEATGITSDRTETQAQEGTPDLSIVVGRMGG